jgi:predicted ATP-dependent Lon-type protease
MNQRKVRLNEQYDYITLTTPNGNFTCNRNGYKSTGDLAMHPTAFDEMKAFVEKERDRSNLGEAMRKLATPEQMDKFFPGWDIVKTNPFEIADTVSIPSMKKYTGGEVIEKRKKNCLVKFSDGLVTVPFTMLTLEKRPNSLEIAIKQNGAYDHDTEI